MSTIEVKLTELRKIPYAPGDIFLRAGQHEQIALITGGTYTHSGICVDSNGTVVDALDRGDESAVASASAIEFFDTQSAPSGGAIYCFIGDPNQAQDAASYAIIQSTLHYEFDITDPIVGLDGDILDNNRLYCSEFVWRCYRYGANVALVDVNNFAEITIDQLADILEFGKPVAVKAMRFRYRHHSGRFVTPQQLAESSLMAERVRVFDRK